MKTLSQKQSEERAAVLAQLKKCPIIQFACERSGVSRATFYRWKKESATFDSEVEEAMSEGIGLMNDLGESQLVTLIKEKKFSAINFWLTHRHPVYRQRMKQDEDQEKEVIVNVTDYGKDNSYTAT